MDRIVKFTKLHGLGNDYIYISNLNQDNDFVSPEEIDFAEMAKLICPRRTGIGSDGLILIQPSDIAEFQMRIFNPDGSEAEMCGNGIRGLARYVYDHGLIKSRSFKVETKAGVKTVEIVGEGLVKVDLGEPVFDCRSIPVKANKERFINEPINVAGRDLRITCVSMGNPHGVIFFDGPITSETVSRLGPEIETLDIFPNRLNAHFVQVMGRKELKVFTWERGAGMTHACGTGAGAVLVAGVLNNYCDRKATIHLLGGDLEIEWSETNHIYMTGPAVEVYSGHFTWSRGH